MEWNIKELQKLFNETITFQYSLPNKIKEIDKVKFTTLDENCFASSDKNNIAKIIYNSIIQYSFNDYEIENKDYQKLLAKSLKTKLKYNVNSDDTAKLKYGFYGEVLFDSFLRYHYSTEALIARGYFYNPLENAETKGYDSYHLVEDSGEIELWFGEVKFHISYSSAIKSALSNIEKALSDDYFEQNIYAFENQLSNLNLKKGKLQEILYSWSDNPEIKIIDEIKKHKMKFKYPILIAYDDKRKKYDTIIKETIDHINKKYNFDSFPLTIDLDVFFILFPVEDVKSIKREVMQWIEMKEPLIL